MSFFILPDRLPVAFDPEKKDIVTLSRTRLGDQVKKCFPVAAFLAPGFTVLHNAAYFEETKTKMLPLFSYAAVAIYKGELYASAVRVDKEKRQELNGMNLKKISQKVKEFKKTFAKNRLVRHLEKCALIYGCPAAKNFFLSRYEAPLPSSPYCNARCIGCISHQPNNHCSVTQPRIDFVPSPTEIAEIALFHIKQVRDPVVSFGQGCEGEPLMVADVIEEAVQLVRKVTKKGIININTNASRPKSIKRLFKAGIDSVRVSINSVREEYYNAYYNPKDYIFNDVVGSILEAKKSGGFVSVNYLVMPGLTDSIKEVDALMKFLKRTKVDMIQWRNLNFDPIEYFEKLDKKIPRNELLGMNMVLKEVKKKFPRLLFGYFNPSAGRIKRARSRK